jgi:radical SAM protein with 4Fe4S-binding SPASM domain
VDRIISELRSFPNLESVILSGGEALLSPHIDYILGAVRQVAPVRYVITNGTTLGSRQRELLKAHTPRTMVTIDSLSESSNAVTRGSNKMATSVETVRWLLDAGIFTIVILVLTRHNISSVRATLSGLYLMGVRNVLIQQLHCVKPSMRRTFTALLPPPSEVHSLDSWLQEFRKSKPDVNIDDNEVCFFENRAANRHKKCKPEQKYLPQRLFMCGAGYKFFALKANGDVIPCNAMLDVVIGNIHKDSICNILANSPIMVGLRNLRTHRVSEIPGCADCPENPICDGGCRADAFNLTDEIGSPHPCCPRHAVSYGII